MAEPVAVRMRTETRPILARAAIVTMLVAGLLPVSAGAIRSTAVAATATGSTATDATAAAATPTLGRAAGADRYATAVAISKLVAPSGTDDVYLASGETFPDALSAGPAAAHVGGVVLLTRKSTLPDSTAAELSRLAPKRVVVLGGPSVVSGAVLTRVRTLTGAVVTRVAGADRYATAAAVSARTFTAGSVARVFLVSGAVFPDALSAGPAAAHAGGPVLLTKPDSLPPATAAELRRLGPRAVTIVGGPGAVSLAVTQAVRALGIPVARVAGSDRYGTAAAVASAYLPKARTALLATGLSFPDALAATPLAAALKAPILLTTALDLPIPTSDAVRTLAPTRIVALGGTSVVSDAALRIAGGWADGALQPPPATPTYPAYDSGYHDPGETYLELRKAEIGYPDLVHVFSIGKSYQGRDIWAVKISDNVMVDENEPEVLVDALHHSREHLVVEQALDLLHLLTQGYATDATVRRLVNSREIYIIPIVNPDGFAYDLGPHGYRLWRKNRQPTPGSSAIGTDLNRNYPYHYACCGGSSSNPAAWNYHGPHALSAPESQAIVDFVESRVIGGKQQIRTHVTLHTNGELILWPYGYTHQAIPYDMTADDHQVFVTMARAMAKTNGYKPEQSSALYVTDGDESDWLFGAEHIFSFTMELYPPGAADEFEPPDEQIAKQVARNRKAFEYLIDAADCPYKVIGKAAQYCGA